MTTTADAQKITRTDDLREFESFARRVRADGLHFKFEAVTSDASYEPVTLTQIDAAGDEITSDDPRYALTNSAKVVVRPGLLNVCLDAKSETNDSDIQIQAGNIADSWVELTEKVDLSSTLINVFDDADGHARLRIRVREAATSSNGSVSGYLTIS